jgi:hypothetical protein
MSVRGAKCELHAGFNDPPAWFEMAGSVKLALHLNAVEHPEGSWRQQLGENSRNMASTSTVDAFEHLVFHPSWISIRRPTSPKPSTRTT